MDNQIDNTIQMSDCDETVRNMQEVEVLLVGGGELIVSLY